MFNSVPVYRKDNDEHSPDLQETVAALNKEEYHFNQESFQFLGSAL